MNPNPSHDVQEVPKGHKLPRGKQWIAHDRPDGRAARRRLRQLARQTSPTTPPSALPDAGDTTQTSDER